ncbi:MAG: hypothetical protein IPL73_22260 [Candidatus Obscuribacter sp.]|nr:hypothetical protein [Candidatus Obscuribacter sp.]
MAVGSLLWWRVACVHYPAVEAIVLRLCSINYTAERACRPWRVQKPDKPKKILPD